VAEPAEAVKSASPLVPQVLVHRTLVAALVIVILSVPSVVFALISQQVPAASWAVMGGLAAVSNLAHGGPRLAYLSVGLLTALTPIAIVSGAVPVAGAALMAIMCFGVGLSAARGLNQGMLMIPLYLAFMIIAPPPWTGGTIDRTSTSYLLWNMLFLGGGGLWAVLVFPRLLQKLKMPLPPRPKPWAGADTLVYTITITVLCTASTLGVLIWWPGSDGAWLVLTVLALTQPGGSTSLKRTFERIPGTIVGVAIAAIVASVASSEAVLLSAGLILMVITIVILLGPHSYFLYSVFITSAVVLFTATSIADVHKTAAERLGFTLAGGALILVASGITLGWAHYQQTHPDNSTQTADA
jgi:hypothetical protein